jgi:outer membrane immunogenic protein
MDNPRASRRLALLIAAVAALAAAAPVQADGWQPGEYGRWVPGTPMTDGQNVSDWSGIYVGGKLGGAWSDINWTENFGEFTAPGGASFSPSSFQGGVFGGGNLQMGNWIFGLETSFIGMGLNQSVSPVVATDSFTTEIDWMLFIEPRIGFSFDRTMVFVKGGWAGGNATLSATGLTGGGALATASSEDFFDGWTIGGGIEYALHPSFIVGIDYTFLQLNLSTAATCDLCAAGVPIGVVPAAVGGNADISLVTARASYWFKPED